MSPDLNDADLERELRRRAEGARLRTDWARFELLPTVRSGLDSRIDRVPSPRLASIAGVAALAAVLVLLVVALPRFVPGQSTGDASPTLSTGPVVLSPQEFAARFEAGDLVGSTALVEGKIVVDDRPALMIPCLPLGHRACPMGRLAGIEPPVSVTTRHIATPEGEGLTHGDGSEAWSWWHLPAPPVEGILALSVQADVPVVEYMGRVKPASDGLTWSANEASELDLKTLAVDEIVLVDGWLTGVGGLISGGAPEPGTFIRGLPQRYSGSPAWVLDERVLLDPSGYQEPENGIRVQSGAYYEFAPNPALVDAASPTLDPRRATYALTGRLEGGGCPGDEPPCWQWNVIGRLTSTAPEGPFGTPEPSTGPPSPTRPRSKSPPPSPRTIGCYFGGPVLQPRVPGTPSPPEGSPTIVDATGLIKSCSTWDTPLNQDDPAVTVSNTNADRAQLEVTWLGNPCDIETTFMFRQSGDSYELRGQRPDVGCVEPLVRHLIVLQLTQPLSFELVAVAVPTIAPSGPPATPTLAPSSRTLECPYETGEDRPLEVEILDNTGLVTSCAAWPAGDPDVPMEISNPAGYAQVLDVTWQVPCISNLMPAQLQLWNRDPDSSRYGQTFLLAVDRLEPTGPQGCRTALAGQRVQLTLSAPLLSADVEGQVLVSGRGTDWTETEAGWFGLDVSADKSEYAADEPIEIQAKLTYIPGQNDQVVISGFVGPEFALEQLDGELELNTGDSVLLCPEPQRLQGDVPLTRSFTAPSSWPPEHPDAGFFERYMYDGQLRLPSGTYRIFAQSSFSIGDGCTGEEVDLRTSVIIRVR